MKKIWSLRRQGILLMTLGLGMFLGNINPTVSKWALAVIVVLYIAWLLIYDFAMTEWSEESVRSRGHVNKKNLCEGNEQTRGFEEVTENVSSYEDSFYENSDLVSRSTKSRQ